MATAARSWWPAASLRTGRRLKHIRAHRVLALEAFCRGPYTPRPTAGITMKIGIVGCAGRMGRALIQEVVTTRGAVLAGGVDVAPAVQGHDLGTLIGHTAPLGIKVGN